MLGKGAKDTFIANTAYNDVAVRVKIFIADGNARYTYPGAKELNYKFTNGLYQMKYYPLRNIGGKYVICSDLFPGRKIRVESYESLKKRAKRDELVGFLIKYTNLSPTMFKIAKENNPNGNLRGNKITPVPFAFDVVKYYKDHNEESGCFMAPGWLE